MHDDAPVPDAPTPIGPDGPRPRPSRGALVGAALGALVVGGVAGYFVGQSAANPKGAYERGVRQGERTTASSFAKGTPRYESIYRTGFQDGRTAGVAEGLRKGKRVGAERGEKVGLERGTQVGRLEGEQQGIQSGARAALGGFPAWELGSLYIVKLAAATQPGVPYRIESRKPMADDTRYAVCAGKPGLVCSEPVPK